MPDSPPAAPSAAAPPADGHGRLTLFILAAIVLALAAAFLFPRAAAATALGGDIFLSLLKMLVVPLVVTSVMTGVIGMGDVRKLGRPGLWTLFYFLGTTAAAVLIGLAVVNLVRPGVGTVTAEQRMAAATSDDPKAVAARVREAARQAAAAEVAAAQADVESAEAAAPRTAAQARLRAAERKLDELTPSAVDVLRDLILLLFTDNLLESAVQMDLLPLIAFSLLLAAVLTTLPGTGALSNVIVQTNEALMAVVLVIMKIAPVGIFCLVASKFGAAAAGGGLGELLARTGWYMAAVLIGLAIHALGVLPLVFWAVRRANPFRFLVQMAEPLLTAFSTASSTATLPVTIEAAIHRAGLSRKSVDFVLPLGATVNMNGTALYEAAAALFIAQVVGMELSLTAQLTVAVTATLAAIGAAGIPEAGLVTMLIVLTAVGLPTEEMSLILSVDWLLDRFRTAVNVWGDAVGAAVVERSLPAGG